MTDLLAKPIQGKGRDLLAKPQEVQESQGFFSSIVSPFKTFARGVAGAGAILQQGAFEKGIQSSVDESNRLIEQARTLPLGDPKKKELLAQARQISDRAAQGAGAQLSTLEKAPTSKQMLGATAQVVGTLAPAGKAVQLGRLGLAGRVGSAALTGAKAGAIGGGIIGLGTGISESQSVGEAIIKSAEGALFGGAGGAVLGAVGGTLGNVARRVFGKAQTTLDDALDITSSTVRKKATIKAFERAGSPGGVKEKGTLFRRYVIEPAERQKKIAQDVQGLVSKRNSPVRNIANITNEMGRISESEVRPFLRSNPSAFNTNQFRSFLKKNVEMPKLFKADPAMERSYNLVLDTATDVIGDSTKTMEGAWDARQVFDDIIDKQFGDAIYNPQSNLSSPVKQAVLDVRRAWNEFIVANTPKTNGHNVFSTNMRKLTNMYSARHNIAEQNWRLVNGTAFARWKAQNPGLWTAIKLGLPTTGIIGGGLKLF